MRVYYRISYKDKNGRPLQYTRDTVERGYLLYKSIKEDNNNSDVKLEEINGNEIVLLRPIIYNKKEVIQSQCKLQCESTSKEKKESSGYFELLTGGMSEQEYNECLSRFAALHGTTLEEWGISDFK